VEPAAVEVLCSGLGLPAVVGSEGDEPAGEPVSLLHPARASRQASAAST